MLLACGPAPRDARDNSNDTTPPADGGTGCDAGATIACTCADGSAGKASCVADGSRFGVCNCGGASTCTPLATQACTCESGATGTAACLADGSRFGVCDCSGSTGCVPSTTQACSCANGASGAQTCQPDGSGFGACGCMPAGCAPGLHDGGDGSCVPVGSCSPGFHDGGDGSCLASGCSSGYHDGGRGDCVSVGGCDDGYAVAPNGGCVPQSSCQTNGPVARIQVVPSVNVGATVEPDGSTSTGAGLAYAWSVTDPQGSSSPLAAVVRPTFLAQLAGTYTVSLTVTDQQACQSATSATVLVSGGSSGGSARHLHVQLTWQADSVPAGGDLDLHMLGPPPSGVVAAWFDAGSGIAGIPPPFGSGRSGTDVFYANATPDWGLNNTTDADQLTANNPTLDVTQANWGSGPENIDQPQTFNGTYTVGAEYFCSQPSITPAGSSTATYGPSIGTVHATITVFVDGVVKASYVSPALDQRDLWPAATITVSGSPTGSVVSVSPSSLPLLQDVQDVPPDPNNPFQQTISAGCTPPAQ